MKIVNIKNTNLSTSKFGFGTSSLHHIIKEKERIKFLKYVYDLGFTHFDTSRMYGEGMAERSLGKFISKYDVRDKITISTKFGINANPLYESLPYLTYADRIFKKVFSKFGFKTINTGSKRDLSLKNVQKSLSKSLNTLQTDYIDIYFLQEPKIEDKEDFKNIISYLEKIKEEGKIKYLGLSGDAKICLDIYNYFPNKFDVLQVEDSIEDFESKTLILLGVKLQFTFGYLRNTQIEEKKEIIKKSLFQNQEGCILISSKNKNNLLEIIEIEKNNS